MPAPLRIGVLHDFPAPPAGTPASDLLERAIELAAREVGDRLDGEIELVDESAEGLPQGTAWAVEQGITSLAGQGVLAVLGPAIGDNALVATPLADRLELPMINWAGTERARSEYMFHLQVGSHEDEGVVLARHLHAVGAERVGVIYDRSPIGRRYLHYFEEECARLGLSVGARREIAVTPDDATPIVTAVRDAGVEALVQLGLGFAALAVAEARTALGWDVPAAGNTWGLRGYQPEYGRAVDGWVYVDMMSDANSTLAHVREALDAPVAAGSRVAYAYDLARLIVEALTRAPERTRNGVREGLEQVKLLDAAEGKEGTQLSFGHWDRGALKGEYLVLRRWQDGATVEV